MGLLGLSATVGAVVAMTPHDASTRWGPAVLPVTACLLVVVVVGGCAVVRFGHRAAASSCLYACALGLALPAARVTGWMTVSDLFLLLGGALLLPQVPNLRLRSSVERGFAWAVALIVVGGLLGTIVAEDTQLSVLNLVRLTVAGGATLMIFALWAPSTTELRRFFALVVASGLATGLWALTHTSSLGRPSGLSFHPNHLALVCLIATGPAVAFSLIRGSGRAARTAAFGATAILVGAIIVSGSRAGLAGLAVAVVVAAVLARNLATRMQLVVGAATVAAAGIVGFSALTTENAISRTFDTQSASAAGSDRGRHIIFTEMMDRIEREPITGVGFADALAGHDAYLQLWAAGGVFALLGGILVLGSAGAAARLARHAPPSSVYDRSWPLLAGTVSLSGLLAALAFQNALWNRYIWVTVALVAASSAVVRSEGASSDDALGTT